MIKYMIMFADRHFMNNIIMQIPKPVLILHLW